MNRAHRRASRRSQFIAKALNPIGERLPTDELHRVIVDAPFFTNRVAGGVAIVGARNDIDAAGNRGTAFVYDANPESATFGSLLSELRSNVPDYIGEFGYSVGTNGDIAVIGARGSAVLLFDVDPASPTFGQRLRLLRASNEHDDNAFGYAVDVQENLALVTAAGGPSTDYLGSAYLIDIDPASPTFGRELWRRPSPLGTAEFFFGYDAALGGGVAVVTDHGGATAGAHVFDADPASPTFGDHLLHIPAPPGLHHDGFGRSIAVSEGLAIIGSRGNQGGLAYLYDVDPASAGFGQLRGVLPAAGEGVVISGEDVAIEGSRVLAGGYTFDSSGVARSVALAYTQIPVPEPAGQVAVVAMVLTCYRRGRKLFVAPL